MSLPKGYDEPGDGFLRSQTLFVFVTMLGRVCESKVSSRSELLAMIADYDHLAISSMITHFYI